MSQKLNNPKATLMALLAIMQGIAKILTGGKTIPFRKGSIDGPGLQALVGPILATFQAAVDQKTSFHNSVVARDAAKPTAEQLIADIKKGVDLQFGEDSTEFTTFGFKPRKKRTPSTGEQNVQKAAKAAATRKARGTLGPKARLQVKGAVPSPAPTPTTPPTNGQVGGSTK
ncbi:MAG TPA: hypothetical protein VFF73_01075 [Planctomycetota bacterium]|nr:hypothetical protein [Planctomycetota bacterium]